METKPIFSLEAEKAVIGSVLINPEVFKTLDLSDKDFYLQAHAEIWRAFQHIVVSGGIIDSISAKEEVSTFSEFEYLANVPSSMHAEQYARTIREKSRRRELVNLATEIVNTSYDENSDLENRIPAFMTKLVSAANIDGGAVHISKVLSELYDVVQARHADPKEIWGIPTGLYDYDILTGGHHPGEATLMSGKAGLGKSILAMQMAFGMAESEPGAIYEMEMGRIQTIRRQVSTVSRVKNRDLRSGHFGENDWDNFAQALAELEH